MTTTETRIVPGKELSRTPLGFRETENSIVLKEITPYAISIARQVCEAQFVTVEYKGLLETVQERRELNCSNAYFDYGVFQITTLGLPLFYEMATGFGIFRGMCEKGPPIVTTTTRESSEKVTEVMPDSTTRRCKEIPVPEASVAVKFNDQSVTLASSADGKVTLPPEQVSAVEKSASNVSIEYQYENETTTTTFLPAARADFQMMTRREEVSAPFKDNSWLSAAKETPLDNNVEKLISEADRSATTMKTMFDEQSAQAKSSGEPATVATATPDKNLDLKNSQTDSSASPITARPDIPDSQLKTGVEHQAETVAALEKNAGQKDSRNEPVDSPVKPPINSQKGGKTAAAGSSEPGKPKTDPANSSATASSAPKTGKSSIPQESMVTIEFDSNNTLVKKRYSDELKKVANEMSSKPNMTIVIEGHTDNIGSVEINRKVSFARAAAAKEILVKKYHAPPERVTVKGSGLTKPLAANDTDEGRAKNRRVELRTEVTLEKPVSPEIKEQKQSN